MHLYFIPPKLDWHKNEAYSWKLNQAWMSDVFYGWVFWNVNGYINLELQVSISNVLFQCNCVEFTFWNNAPHGHVSDAEGTLTMKNVEMAAFLSTEYEYNKSSPTTMYNPCNGRGKCHAFNGKITCVCGSSWKFGAPMVSLVVALIVLAIAKQTSDASLYNRISQEEVTELNDSSSHDYSQGDDDES